MGRNLPWIELRGLITQYCTPFRGMCSSYGVGGNQTLDEAERVNTSYPLSQESAAARGQVRRNQTLDETERVDTSYPRSQKSAATRGQVCRNQALNGAERVNTPYPRSQESAAAKGQVESKHLMELRGLIRHIPVPRNLQQLRGTVGRKQNLDGGERVNTPYPRSRECAAARGQVETKPQMELRGLIHHIPFPGMCSSQGVGRNQNLDGAERVNVSLTGERVGMRPN